MNFDLEDPIPIVQEKKKYANFTVSVIGGPEEIGAWRAKQKVKEDLYKLKIMNRDQRITNFETELGGKVEAPTVHTSSWHEKLAFAKSERERLAKPDERVSEMPWVPIEEPKKSIFQKIGHFFKNIWKNANF